MLDISAINIKSLSEEETDLWCSKILEVLYTMFICVFNAFLIY